jgi:hypothetical protein
MDSQIEVQFLSGHGPSVSSCGVVQRRIAPVNCQFPAICQVCKLGIDNTRSWIEHFASDCHAKACEKVKLLYSQIWQALSATKKYVDCFNPYEL